MVEPEEGIVDERDQSKGLAILILVFEEKVLVFIRSDNNFPKGPTVKWYVLRKILHTGKTNTIPAYKLANSSDF